MNKPEVSKESHQVSLATLIVTSTASDNLAIKGKWRLECKGHNVDCGF